MAEVGEFYGQEEEGFEELVEKNLGTRLQDNDDDDDEMENEADLLSDVDKYEEEEFGIDKAAMKREERLHTVLSMSRNPLASSSVNVSRDEQVIRRRITMLCSALGGFDPNPPSEYILGVEALGCLKDIKHWLKHVDEDKNVWSVASACHDSGLFINDLIPIMVQYGMTDIENGNPETLKILLSTLELMVRLLTPMRLQDESKENKKELYSKLKRAQIEYKYHLLHYKKGKIFKYIIALIVPILALDKKNVTRRDNIILNLCLTFFANVLRIQPSDAKSSKRNRSNVINVFEALPPGISQEDISLDVVFTVFKKYQVLSVVQTIASNLSKEFETEILGTACLDFYFYAFLYVDPKSLSLETSTSTLTSSNRSSLITETLSRQLNLSDNRDVLQEQEEKQITSANSKLQSLMQVETQKKKELFSKNSTRHANFGSLINVQDKKNGNRVLSGQNKLMNENIFEMLDSNASKIGTGKIFNRTTYSSLAEVGSSDKWVKLNYKTKKLMSKFVEDFIENCYAVVCKEIYNALLKNSSVNDYTFHYHYFFVMDWILKYEKNYQTVAPRDLKTVERYKYLFYCFSGSVIKSLINKFIPLFNNKTTYDLLVITTSVLTEIIQAAATIHSYERYDTSKLLDDDKMRLRAIISRGEASLRLIFEVKTEIKELFKIPHGAHKKSYAVAMGMIDFVNTLLKIINYILRLKVPIMLVNKNSDDFDEDGMFEGDQSLRMLKRNLERYKTLDKDLCEYFKELLFHENTVDVYIWLFYQYKDISEFNLKKCLSYFSKLLKKWDLHFFKLVRLDFMLTLHDLKNASISNSIKAEFGDLLNFFMHKFTKLCANTPFVLLEPMSFSEINDMEIKKYYLTGDSFASADFTVREQRIMKSGNEDIEFVEENVSNNRKIALLISYFYYGDNLQLVELLVEFLNQWYNEFMNTIDDDVTIVGRLNSFRLEGECFKQCRVNPYFRLLCRVGNIINGILISRDPDALLQFKQNIEISINTPLESIDIENQFKDPNVEQRELTERRKRTGKSKHNDESGDDQDGSDEYDNVPEKHSGYADAGIIADDLADSGDEELDELEMLEGKLKSAERTKGKAMKKNADGELVEMGNATKKKRKKTKKDKKDNSKKHKVKRRKIIQDDDGLLSDNEILRRSRLSEKYINDSDEDMSDDDEFFERELQLQKLLQKRQGKITKAQYDALNNGTLDIENVSDLDDHFTGDETNQETDIQNNTSQQTRDTLLKILQPAGARSTPVEDSEVENSQTNEINVSDDENNNSNNETSNSDDEANNSDDETNNSDDETNNSDDEANNSVNEGVVLNYSSDVHMDVGVALPTLISGQTNKQSESVKENIAQFTGLKNFENDNNNSNSLKNSIDSDSDDSDSDDSDSEGYDSDDSDSETSVRKSNGPVIDSSDISDSENESDGILDSDGEYDQVEIAEIATVNDYAEPDVMEELHQTSTIDKKTELSDTNEKISSVLETSTVTAPQEEADIFAGLREIHQLINKADNS